MLTIEERVAEVLEDMHLVRDNTTVTSSRMQRIIGEWIDHLNGETDTPAGNLPGGARVTDPSTSKRGAFDAEPRTGSQRRKILVSIISSFDGRTSDEVTQNTGIKNSHKRLSELKQGGWIRANGERLGESGSMQSVYVPTMKAIDWWEDHVS